MSKVQIGLIADTHGLIRPQALDALNGCDLIIHAGDVGKPEVLVALEKIAPVTAVRGNVDRGHWAEMLPHEVSLEIEEVRLHVLHDIKELAVDPAAAGFSAVISGHSHRASLQVRSDVHFINPGSAGPRRFRLPVSVALLAVNNGSLHPALIELQIGT
jgi:putative phosphoesterase